MFERGSLVVFDGRVYEVVRIMRNGSYMIRSNIQRWTMNVAGTALSAANAVQSNDYNVAVLMLGRPCSWRDRLYRINGFVDAVTVELWSIPRGEITNAPLSEVQFELTQEQEEAFYETEIQPLAMVPRKPRRQAWRVHLRKVTILDRSWAVFKTPDGVLPISDEEQALLMSLNVTDSSGVIGVDIAAFSAYADWWQERNTLIGLYLRHMLSLA